MRELKIGRLLNHNNIQRIKKVINLEEQKNVEDSVYCAFELMDYDLGDLLTDEYDRP